MNDITDMERERALAVNEFLRKELKWNEESNFETKWSQVALGFKLSFLLLKETQILLNGYHMNIMRRVM